MAFWVKAIKNKNPSTPLSLAVLPISVLPSLPDPLKDNTKPEVGIGGFQALPLITIITLTVPLAFGSWDLQPLILPAFLRTTWRIWALASPRPWTRRSAAWGWTGPARWS